MLSVFRTKTLDVQNLSQLIKATVPHVGFLRMSDCQASSNPRICFAPCGKNVTMKNKSLSFVDASEPSHTLISADASIAPISHLCCLATRRENLVATE